MKALNIFKNKIFCTILLAITSFNCIAQSSSWVTSFYSQNVYLKNSKNLINQSSFKLIYLTNAYDLYGGFYFDDDNKSDIQTTYTDKQFSPLIGIQSKVILPNFPIRLFFEARDVNRQGEFPDGRASHTNEFRPGMLGYNLHQSDHLFNEYYFATFYSSLYNQKILAQGWNKAGYKQTFQQVNIDLFGELFGDSFDLTKQSQLTFDFRPGVRLSHIRTIGSLQLMYQHLIPIDHSGRKKEDRVTFVLFLEI